MFAEKIYKQKCINPLILVELHYYPFISGMNRCDRSFNTVENVFGRVCIPNLIDEGGK